MDHIAIDDKNATNLKRCAEELKNIRLLNYMKAAREAWVVSDDEYHEFLLKAVKPIREMMKGETR